MNIASPPEADGNLCVKTEYDRQKRCRIFSSTNGIPVVLRQEIIVFVSRFQTLL